MRIGCLQFAPQVGDVDNNLNRADAVLSKANPKNLDLLVLPEMAFSGYNFRSLQHITPFLEPTTSGITSLWARTTALKYNCVVTVGYPEKVDITPKWPASPEYYNSAVIVNSEGQTIANYRKSFLYYTDETWALEGPDGFYDGYIEGLGNTAMGICKWPTTSFERMDLNPYKFEAPWTSWEFAHHILHKEANLVIISMAWLTREEPRSYSRTPKDPDMDTLAYWLARLEPIIREETEGEIIVVLANRTGTEEEAVYAGTSCVLGIHGGEVKVYGVLGRGERELLIVDTNKPPQAKLVSEPNTAASNVSEAITENSIFTKNSESSALTVDTAFTPPILEHDEEYVGMTDLLTPITPADPVSPNAYFMKFPRPRPENAQESLRSSIAEPKFGSTLPGSPTFRRPESPKSRNASRTRQAEEQKPALISHDLAVEEELSPRPVSVRSPPISASAGPPQTDMIAENNLHGTRSRSSSNHASPRPKSTLW